jgi:hypothetical protein
MDVLLYGSETWSLILKEELKLMLFEQGAKENIWTDEG